MAVADANASHALPHERGGRWAGRIDWQEVVVASFGGTRTHPKSCPFSSSLAASQIFSWLENRMIIN